jgi:vitamin-K-epoxide reductase (warfarin-sensitive)
MRPAVSERPARNRILFAVIAMLSFVGVVDSAIALQRHYAKSATNFCDFSQQFSCDVVNRSEWSTVAGIPVAAIGMAGYAGIFVLSTFLKSRAETPNRLLVGAIAGLAFALYLTYIEAFELRTWCVLCLISLLLIFLITMLALAVKVRSSRA